MASWTMTGLTLAASFILVAALAGVGRAGVAQAAAGQSANASTPAAAPEHPSEHPEHPKKK